MASKIERTKFRLNVIHFTIETLIYHVCELVLCLLERRKLSIVMPLDFRILEEKNALAQGIP